jgi:mycoredoxin
LAGRLELYGTASCPYTAELREQLEWDGREFADFDVEADAAAAARLAALTGGRMSVPVLVEDGRVIQVGWQGRCCLVQAPQAPPGIAASPRAGSPAGPGAPPGPGSTADAGGGEDG